MSLTGIATKKTGSLRQAARTTGHRIALRGRRQLPQRLPGFHDEHLTRSHTGLRLLHFTDSEDLGPSRLSCRTTSILFADDGPGSRTLAAYQPFAVAFLHATPRHAHEASFQPAAALRHSRQDVIVTLTSHSTLRDRLLTYLAGVGGSSTRAQALDALDVLYAGQWTTEDISPQNTRQFETKWRNRVSFERQRLVERGVLQARSDGVWALADGFDPSRIDLPRLAARNAEIRRREDMWVAAKAAGAPDDILPRALEPLHLRAGGRGIYVDVATTKSAIAPAGVAVSFLDLGQAYANERNVHGVIYRLPRTTREGRDQAEIAAAVRAYELAMPVFVILPGARPASRSVRRAVVESVDIARGSVLITFLDDDPLPPEPGNDENDEFELVIDDVETRWQRRKARPNQARFAFAVLQRYGARCAVCDLDAEPVIEAAHIRAKALQGSDDARNGIPLCSNHHRMYDAGWYAFEPLTTEVVFRAQQNKGQSRVIRSNLSHLPLQPSRKALEDAWERWSATS